MRKIILIVIVILNIFSAQGFARVKQTSEPDITILNRENQATSQITDGDGIHVQITLSQPVSQQENITFILGESSLPGGSCIITNGDTTCTTDLFTSLGWYWDSGGVPQNMRIVQAKNDNTELIEQSNPITVLPRPVVMVHGFISNWQAWASYLEPDVTVAAFASLLKKSVIERNA